MKILEFLLYFLLFYKISSEYALQYEDTREMALKRLQFGQNNTERVSRGKVNFEFTDSNGVYCKANSNLYEKEFAFKIPKEFIICSFDIFPFKFELQEAIMGFLKKKYLNANSDTKTRGPMYLFAFHMMFIKYENKSLVFDYLKMNNMEYYMVNYTKDIMSYVDSLPTSTYTTHMYSEVDRRFIQSIGFAFDKGDETNEIYEYVIDYINQNNLPKMKKVLLPFISNLDLFRYSTSIITSRAYKSLLQEYQSLFNFTMESTPKGKKHKKLILEMNPDGAGTCLVPFVDLCNHKSSDSRYGKDKIDFMILFKQNEVKLSFGKKFKEGEEYVYSYAPSSPNEKLLFSYGFYVENNPQSIAGTFVPILKKFFPKAKHDLCLKIKCIDNPFTSFYDDDSRNHANIQFYFNQYEISNNVLNLIRLYVLPSDKFQPQPLYKRLSKKKWISYENEVLALTYYRGCLVFHFEQFPIKKVYNK
jgi:hypothetical protein